MCCFSRPVRFVGKTRIFARGLPGGDQLLVYAMDLDIDEELAMVLPIPVPQGSADDSVTFVDLQGYASFFEDLESAFPPDYSTSPQPKSRGLMRSAPAKPKLVVHDVGLFEASFVPTREDFSRLDARFRLPEGVWEKLPKVASFGFAVFRLKPKKRGFLGLGSSMQSVHPMAFRFPRRDPSALFFPTLHVHDDEVAATAAFDHGLYCQADGVLGATLGWTPSHAPLGESVAVDRARELVDGARGAFRLGLNGTRPNEDFVLRAPAGLTLDDLSGREECHAFRLMATYAYDDTMHSTHVAWRDTARSKLPALAIALREGLRALVAKRRDEWHLAPLRDGLPAHFMNGPQLWTGTTYMDGAPASPGGPGRLVMRPFTDHVEPQEVTFGFAELPDRARLDEISATLRALLDRAVA